MYLQHFGLVQYPFSLTPNTRFFLKLPSHQQAFELLLKAIELPGSFAKITGEVGTGKTMLCRKVILALESHKNRFVTAYIPNPVLDEEGMMHAIAEELGISTNTDISYFEVIKLVSAELVRINASGRIVILFIDEAQALSEEALAAIQLLTKLDTKENKYIQVVLFGQPELDELLEHASLSKLVEQLSFSFVLPELDREGTEAYIRHRVHKSGFNGSHLFTEKAINRLYKSSKGVPRMINILAHKSLMSAFGTGEHRISEDHVDRAIADTETVRQQTSITQRFFGN